MGWDGILPAQQALCHHYSRAPLNLTWNHPPTQSTTQHNTTQPRRAKLPEELAPFLCDLPIPPPPPPRAEEEEEEEAAEDADAALAASEPSGPVPDHGLPLVHARGRVCSMRVLGRAMIFFDLVDPGVQP
jgi:hypothetical protein